MEPFSGQQTIVTRVPVAELDEAGRIQTTLETKNFFRAFRQIVGQGIGLIVERANLAFHPTI